MRKRTRYGSALLAALVLALAVACAQRPANERPPDTPSIEELARTEVREYQGKNLSSIADFRENSIKGPQYVDRDTYRLRITGLVDQPRSLTYDEVLADRKRYKKVVRLDCVEGWSVDIRWEGVLVRHLLAYAGVESSAKTVILKARDGYSTSFPVDYFYGDRDIIMAYRMNDLELPAERGFPFQLVAEDKWGYKWIKWIEEIELSADEGYRGFWESRGYSNTGDRDKPSFGED